MTKHAPDGELRFEQDYSAAQFDDGSVVKFTRLERRALKLFNESAGRILTRAQILDAVSEPGSEKNDRSIDFLINRIRAKLAVPALASVLVVGVSLAAASVRQPGDWSQDRLMLSTIVNLERLEAINRGY